MNHDVNCSVLKKLSDRALKECGFNTKPVKLNTITIYRHKLQTGGVWFTADIQPYTPHYSSVN